ncbi:MAG: hypothetical protein V5A62_07875 [Haloarculaceae archaeon]
MSQDRASAVVHRALAVVRGTGRTASSVLADARADHTALALFFGSLAFYTLYWRVDVFIVDTFAVANTVAALSRGSLAVDPIVFGPSGEAFPGLHAVDGRLYGRNYGHAAAAVPFLWALRALSAVVDVRVLLSGLWSLVVLGAAVGVGRAVGIERPARLVGSALALLLLGANLTGSEGLPPDSFPLIALGLTTMLSASLLAVVAYRLLRSVHGYRVGAFAGITTAIVGPVGFWAPIPKRHTVTALLALVGFYGFYRSRTALDAGRSRSMRAVPYAAAALTAWVSAPEGLALLAALVPIDLLTARENRPRTLALLGGAFLLALVPFLLTNAAISGSPLLPPRVLPDYVVAVDSGSSAVGTGSSTLANGPDPGSGAGDTADGSTLPGVLAPLLGGVGTALDTFLTQLDRGVRALEPRRLFHVLVRSGRVPGVDYTRTGGHTVELTLLEAAPVVGGLLGVPAALRAARLSVRPAFGSLRRDPARATDLFAAGYVAAFGLLYLPRLPLHSTVTVRYLVPIVPFLVYGVCRLDPVHRVVGQEGERLAALAAVLTLAGVVLAAVALAGTGPGTAMQAHAVANLTVAGLFAAWLAAALRTDLDPRLGAAVLALVLAAAVAFLLLSGVEYFGQDRQFALPVARAIEQLLPVR